MCVCVCDCHVRFGGPEIMTRGSQQMGPFVTKYLPQIRWVFFLSCGEMKKRFSLQ